MPMLMPSSYQLRLALVPLLLFAPMANALEPDQIFERVSPSVWRVSTNDANSRPLSLGSAVVIAPERAVTNCHVLAKASAVFLVKENQRLAATLELLDPERDLCQLKVPNLRAPAVTRATESQLRVGARAYAVGNPRGLDLTLSDGLVSALRRDKANKLYAIQTSAPISEGSSGGGLFDSEARLLGLTTSQLVNGQNLNFAIPADWILELPQRHGEVMAKREAAKQAAAASAAPATNSATGKPAATFVAGKYAVGDTYIYTLTDRTVRKSQDANLQVDRIDGDTVRFNGGAVVFRTSGELVSIKTAVLGELDIAMPPQGWPVLTNAKQEQQSLSYTTDFQGTVSRYSLTASFVGEETMQLGNKQIKAQSYQLRGHLQRAPNGLNLSASGTYTATIWYSAELKRAVKYEVLSRGVGSGLATFYLNDTIELTQLPN
jgi:serine protease Do